MERLTYTCKEVCEMIGCDIKTVKKLIREGKLLKIEGLAKYFITAKSLKAWITSAKTTNKGGKYVL